MFNNNSIKFININKLNLQFFYKIKIEKYFLKKPKFTFLNNFFIFYSLKIFLKTICTTSLSRCWVTFSKIVIKKKFLRIGLRINSLMFL